MQREASTTAQRHTTSNAIRSVETQLRDLQQNLALREPETAELQKLQSSMSSSQETVTGLQQEISRLNQQFGGSLKGVRAVQKEIEQQLTQVG